MTSFHGLQHGQGGAGGVGHFCTGGEGSPLGPKPKTAALGSESTPKCDTPLLSLVPQVIKGTVNIQVGDVNDNAPQFHNQPYSVRIPEVGTSLPRPSGATPALCLPPELATHVQPALGPQEGGEDEIAGSDCLKMGKSKVVWVLGEEDVLWWQLSHDKWAVCK